MPRLIPRYIQDAPIFETKIGYEWDDLAIDQYFDYDDADLSDRLIKVSDRANIAFTIAIGEWTVHRFDRVSSDRTPHQYFEALWAGSIDWRYLSGTTLVDEEWEGAVRRPMDLAMFIGGEAIVAALEQKPVAFEVARMTHLTRHVLPDTDVFNSWHEKVVQRLEQLFPTAYDPDDLFLEGDELGPPVPREAFDVDSDYDPAMGEQWTSNFLRGISSVSNIFLRTEKEMQEHGFKGTPYR